MLSVVLIKGASANLLGFRVAGHAGFSEYGKDIVCAGVSSITQAALLGLQDILGSEKVHYRMSPGYLEVLLKPDEAADPRARAILRSLELGLLAIRRAYNDHISLEYQEQI